MGELFFDLEPGAGGLPRSYRLVDAPSDYTDAVLTIRTGEVGPRGGTSKVCNRTYFVQEDTSPEYAELGRVFLLVKRGGGRSSFFVPDSGKGDEGIHEVVVPASPALQPTCSCPGFKFGGDCKHTGAFWHLVHVVGWCPEREGSGEVVKLLQCGL